MGRKKSIKRENGTGSVYKRSDLKKRPWVAVIPATYDQDGNPKRQVIGHYATAQEAKDALDEYRRNPTTKINITLDQLHNEWVPIAYRSITKATRDNYDAAWLKLEPLWPAKFREIRTAQMQQIIDAYSQPWLDKSGKERSPMSQSSLSKIKALLTQLYNYAMENDVVNKNYASFLSLPKQKAKKKDCFADLEVAKIERAAGIIPYADVILMMCYTGFRISEFLELTPESYDRAAGGLIGGKKTEAGTDRFVPVHPKIKKWLDAWIAKGGQTIICKDDGAPYSADYFRRRVYYPTLDAIGVRRLTPHATRHTFATRMAAAGVRPEDLQAIIGHEDYEVTASTYIHQSKRTLIDAVLKMG